MERETGCGKRRNGRTIRPLLCARFDSYMYARNLAHTLVSTVLTLTCMHVIWLTLLCAHFDSYM